MGATPIASHRNEGGRMPKLWRNDTPVAAPRGEMAVWGYVVRPSLMPTIFAPSGSRPAISASEEMAARKV
jgi:hypothetical protein